MESLHKDLTQSPGSFGLRPTTAKSPDPSNSQSSLEQIPSPDQQTSVFDANGENPQLDSSLPDSPTTVMQSSPERISEHAESDGIMIQPQPVTNAEATLTEAVSTMIDDSA